MAITHDNSTELDNVITDLPREPNPVSSWGGKLQIAFFTHDQSGTGDAGSDVGICKLPAGRVRVIIGLSRAYINWTTGSATLDLGWDAYTGLDGVAVVADPDGLVDGLDVDAVGMFGFDVYATLPAAKRATGGTHLFTSSGGVTIRATSPTAMVSGDDLVGYLVYVCD